MSGCSSRLLKGLVGAPVRDRHAGAVLPDEIVAFVSGEMVRIGGDQRIERGRSSDRRAAGIVESMRASMRSRRPHLHDPSSARHASQFHFRPRSRPLSITSAYTPQSACPEAAQQRLRHREVARAGVGIDVAWPRSARSA